MCDASTYMSPLIRATFVGLLLKELCSISYRWILLYESLNRCYLHESLIEMCMSSLIRATFVGLLLEELCFVSRRCVVLCCTTASTYVDSVFVGVGHIHDGGKIP